MPKNDVDVGTGLVGAPACGDVMKLQIRVDPNTQTISDVKFKTFGCGSAIASSSYLTQLVRGMTLEKASRIKNTEIAKELCLPPVKCEFWSVFLCSDIGAWVFERKLKLIVVYSALLYAGRGCDQVRHLELLHKESKCQTDGSRWDGCINAGN